MLTIVFLLYDCKIRLWFCAKLLIVNLVNNCLTTIGEIVIMFLSLGRIFAND